MVDEELELLGETSEEAVVSSVKIYSKLAIVCISLAIDTRARCLTAAGSRAGSSDHSWLWAISAIRITSNAIPRAVNWIVSCWCIRQVTSKTVEPLRQGLCAQAEGEHSELQNEAGENNHPHCNL